MRGPGGFDGGRVCDELVSHVDIYPTICDLVGIEKPERIHGKSILPLVNGQVNSIRDSVFAEVNYHASYEPQRSVRTKRWKYTRRYDGRTSPVLPNCDDGFSKTLYVENGWKEVPPASEALYDLVFDPYETCNLTGEDRCADALKDMRSRLDKWMKDTNDPLSSGGFVAAPQGAIINDPDGMSPGEAPMVID
jgi:arylsulfatase A-like enzyme